MAKRYSSWGSDVSYRWLWRAALQDGIFAFKRRMNKKHPIKYKSIKDIDEENIRIMKNW